MLPISLSDSEVDALLAVRDRDRTCRPSHAGICHLLSLSPSQGDALLGLLGRVSELARDQPVLADGRNPSSTQFNSEPSLHDPVIQTDRSGSSTPLDAGSTPAGITDEDDACDFSNGNGAADPPRS